MGSAKPPLGGAGGKDVWDKIAALTVPFVTLVIGLVGAYATFTYNESSLRQQRAQAEADRLQRAADTSADRLQREQQARDAKVVADAQQLEKLFIYVASSDPQKREFGYAMFAALGNKELAAQLIALKHDKAGIRVLNSLKRDASAVVRAAATESLAAVMTARQSEVVLSTLRRAVAGGRYETAAKYGNDVIVGIGGWTARSGGVNRLVARYCADPAAQVRALCATGSSIAYPVTAEQLALLKEAVKDPAMRRAQDAQADADLASPGREGEALAQQMGLRLPVGVALITETLAQFGSSEAKRLARQATESLGKGPTEGADEKEWIRAYLAARSAPRYILARERNSYYQRLIASNDWDMQNVPAGR